MRDSLRFASLRKELTLYLGSNTTVLSIALMRLSVRGSANVLSETLCGRPNFSGSFSGSVLDDAGRNRTAD
jgi:hypothetical protein